MSAALALQITHDTVAHRFEAVVDGQHCVLTYQLQDAVLTITHTGVPQAVGGRGIAAQLLATALAVARREGWRVRPACSYAAAYFKRHAEQRDLLA